MALVLTKKLTFNTFIMSQEIAAELLVRCLEAEGVEYIFGLPGEENIHFINALHKSDKIRFILVRHEQGASFMADVYGRLTGKAGVCIATLGPGAINLMLGVTDANSDSAPVVAITAQVGLDRIYKETHQYVDLKSIFKNITKWSDTVYTTDSIPEMIRMAFDKAQCERPGAAYLGIPQDIEYAPVSQTLSPIRQHPRHTIFPDADYVNDAAKMLGKAKSPIILIGHGAVKIGRAHV